MSVEEPCQVIVDFIQETNTQVCNYNFEIIYGYLSVKEPSDMIFVKTFTLADFGPVIFYPKARNLLES